MENHQLLLSLYNELDEVLREYYRDNNPASSVIMKFIKELERSGSAKYEEYGRTLNMIRIIRNDLIHDLDMNSKRLITVNDQTISFLTEVVETLRHPVSALDICTKFEKLSYISTSEGDIKIVDLIKLMREKGFSQLPVIGEGNTLYGVFSPNVVFDYLKENPGDISKTKLSDIMDYLPLTRHFSESYFFVKANANIRVVSELFLNEFQKNKKPMMAFVSRNGGDKEPVLGIIVEKNLVDAF